MDWFLDLERSPSCPWVCSPNRIPFTVNMTRFFGLRGSKLHLAIWMEACFAVVIFGYNQASAGGVLGDPTFNLQFPRLNTISTTGSLQKYNARIQGESMAQRPQERQC